MTCIISPLCVCICIYIYIISCVVICIHVYVYAYLARVSISIIFVIGEGIITGRKYLMILREKKKQFSPYAYLDLLIA